VCFGALAINDRGRRQLRGSRFRCSLDHYYPFAALRFASPCKQALQISGSCELSLGGPFAVRRCASRNCATLPIDDIPDRPGPSDARIEWFENTRDPIKSGDKHHDQVRHDQPHHRRGGWPRFRIRDRSVFGPRRAALAASHPILLLQLRRSRQVLRASTCRRRVRVGRPTQRSTAQIFPLRVFRYEAVKRIRGLRQRHRFVSHVHFEFFKNSSCCPRPRRGPRTCRSLVLSSRRGRPTLRLRKRRVRNQPHSPPRSY